ncbi:MAG: hypothetical protein IJH34_13850 [Romboutsia sp.]|nr:hypothetical protein [Romboutsia sp.]
MNNKMIDTEIVIESYNEILRQLYDNIYGEDIKEVPLSSGEYIITSRTELGLIYQKLAMFEENLELVRKQVIEDTKKEYEDIIHQAKLKSFTIYEDNVDIKSNDLELVKTIKNLASDNLLYLYEKIKKQTEQNIESLIGINKEIRSNIEELEDYADVYNIRKNTYKKMKQTKHL